MERRESRLDGGLGVEAPRRLPGLHRFSHEAMATVFEVHTAHPDAGYAAQAAQAAFDLCDRLEAELSRFRTNSDVSRVNHLAAGEHTRVSPTTFECLAIARQVYDLTGGAFDVSIGTGLTRLELDPDALAVRAVQEGARIDLGGIGKGFAVDLMAVLLEEWGIGEGLVHGGFSSVLALDPPPGGAGWALTLSDPAVPSRVLARLSVAQAALSASGLRKGEHIRDPRTGQPASGRSAAWVRVPRPDAARAEGAAGREGPRPAAVADALTTAFMLLDTAEIEAICDASPGLDAWILPEAAEPPAPADPLHFGRRPEP